MPVFCGSKAGRISQRPTYRRSSCMGRKAKDDVCDTIREFMRRGVVIRTRHQQFRIRRRHQGPDAASRPRRADRLHGRDCFRPSRSDQGRPAGRNRARQAEFRPCLPWPQPELQRDQFNAARAMLGQEALGIAQIAKETGLMRQAVYRIKDDPVGAEAALAMWGM